MDNTGLNSKAHLRGVTLPCHVPDVVLTNPEDVPLVYRLLECFGYGLTLKIDNEELVATIQGLYERCVQCLKLINTDTRFINIHDSKEVLDCIEGISRAITDPKNLIANTDVVDIGKNVHLVRQLYLDFQNKALSIEKYNKTEDKNNQEQWKKVIVNENETCVSSSELYPKNQPMPIITEDTEENVADKMIINTKYIFSKNNNHL